jgi:hypothetical protein
VPDRKDDEPTLVAGFAPAVAAALPGFAPGVRDRIARGGEISRDKSLRFLAEDAGAN